MMTKKSSKHKKQYVENSDAKKFILAVTPVTAKTNYTSQEITQSELLRRHPELEAFILSLGEDESFKLCIESGDREDGQILIKIETVKAKQSQYQQMALLTV